MPVFYQGSHDPAVAAGRGELSAGIAESGADEDVLKVVVVTGDPCVPDKTSRGVPERGLLGMVMGLRGGHGKAQCGVPAWKAIQRRSIRPSLGHGKVNQLRQATRDDHAVQRAGRMLKALASVLDKRRAKSDNRKNRTTDLANVVPSLHLRLTRCRDSDCDGEGKGTRNTVQRIRHGGDQSTGQDCNSTPEGAKVGPFLHEIEPCPRLTTDHGIALPSPLVGRLNPEDKNPKKPVKPVDE